jgi:hypothetical protein
VSRHNDHSKPDGAKARRGWALLTALLAWIGLALAPLPPAPAAAPSAGLEQPLAADHAGKARPGATRSAAARSKSIARPAGTEPAPPATSAIVPSFITPDFVLRDSAARIRPNDARAPLYRVAAQPRAPPASRV